MFTRTRQAILGLPRPIKIAAAVSFDFSWSYTTVQTVLDPHADVVICTAFGVLNVAAFVAYGTYGWSLIELASGRLRYLWILTFGATIMWLIVIRIMGSTLGTSAQVWGICLLTVSVVTVIRLDALFLIYGLRTFEKVCHPKEPERRD